MNKQTSTFQSDDSEFNRRYQPLFANQNNSSSSYEQQNNANQPPLLHLPAAAESQIDCEIPTCSKSIGYIGSKQTPKNTTEIEGFHEASLNEPSQWTWEDILNTDECDRESTTNDSTDCDYNSQDFFEI